MNLLLDLERMVAILDFLPTMQCLKYFPTIPLCQSKIRICLYCVENNINLLFDLGQMAAILDFTINAHYIGHT